MLALRYLSTCFYTVYVSHVDIMTLICIDVCKLKLNFVIQA